jgi:hypothetical protein
MTSENIGPKMRNISIIWSVLCGVMTSAVGATAEEVHARHVTFTNDFKAAFDCFM